MNRTADSQIVHLHAILHELLLSPTTEDNGAMILFISCCSVSSNLNQRRFGNASDLSPMLAALKHFARCLVAMEIYLYGSESTTISWERVAKLDHPNVDNGLHYLQYCLKVCNRIRNGETHNVRFLICPTHARCAIIDGVELPLSDLGVKMKELQRRSLSLLIDKLLNGLKISDDFWSSVQTLDDNLADLTPRYWFSMHTANNYSLFSWSLAVHKGQKSSLLKWDSALNEEKAQIYLQDCENLQQYIYTLLQTCSGAPERAS